MDIPQPQFRCEACNRIFREANLVCNRWGDPYCPDCGSPGLIQHRSKLSGVTSILFIFNVF